MLNSGFAADLLQVPVLSHPCLRLSLLPLKTEGWITDRVAKQILSD